MYFDESHYEKGGAFGIVFITPQGMPMHVSFKLSFECINTSIEYEALILGLKLKIKMKYECLKIYGDSLLIVNKIKGM